MFYTRCQSDQWKGHMAAGFHSSHAGAHLTRLIQSTELFSHRLFRCSLAWLEQKPAATHDWNETRLSLTPVCWLLVTFCCIFLVTFVCKTGSGDFYTSNRLFSLLVNCLSDCCGIAAGWATSCPAGIQMIPWILIMRQYPTMQILHNCSLFLMHMVFLTCDS